MQLSSKETNPLLPDKPGRGGCHTTWSNMAGFRLFRGYVQRTPKFLACFQVARGEVHTKAVRTIEELESVYNERKCFINGKLCYH